MERELPNQEHNYQESEDDNQPGVWFDPNEAVLEGTYLDELSAYRARRVWTETFETNFLLEPNYDFFFHVVHNQERTKFTLKCDFSSACGRFAFWRLTRNQAPEVQYMIETAHIPINDERRAEMVLAPELQNDPLILGGAGSGGDRKPPTVSQFIRRIRRFWR